MHRGVLPRQVQQALDAAHAPDFARALDERLDHRLRRHLAPQPHDPVLCVDGDLALRHVVVAEDDRLDLVRECRVVGLRLRPLVAVAERLRLADRGRRRVALHALAAPREAASARSRPVPRERTAAAAQTRIAVVRGDPADQDPAQEPVRPLARHRPELIAQPAAGPATIARWPSKPQRCRSNSERSGPSSTGSVITFDPDRLAARLAELEREMSEPGFWDDQEHAQRISTEHSRVSKRVELYERLRREYEDAAGLLELEPEMADEIEVSVAPLRRELDRLQEAALFDGEYDAGDAVVTLQSGTGG